MHENFTAAETRDKRSVLMLHAFYRMPGGEDKSFEEECRLFEGLGFDVIRYTVKNSDMKIGLRGLLKALFNIRVFVDLRSAIRAHSPSVIYVNNLWPGISSSALFAARFSRVPLLQAVRNYRLVAPSAKLRNDGSCYVCGGSRHPLSCIVSGCYNGSRMQSLVVAIASAFMRLATLGWQDHRYLATSQSTKVLLVTSGLSLKRIAVRPNFDASELEPNLDAGAGIVVVGRLSAEKGILEVARSWPTGNPQLTIIGEGPLAPEVSTLCESRDNIRWLGHLSGVETREVLRTSALAIVPSVWAEPFGRVAIEAMSVGTPVACTPSGALPEIVGASGFVLEEISPESLADLASSVGTPEHQRVLRRLAYERYRLEYALMPAMTNMRAHLQELGVHAGNMGP